MFERFIMKKVFALVVASFACVLAATVPAKAESVEVESKIQHEPLTCIPTGGTCMSGSCCSGYCVSCGAAEMFCRTRPCQ